MKRKLLSIPLWILTVFMALVAIVYFPSTTSILAILFAVICAPVGRLQAFFQSKNLKGAVKAVLLVVLFFAAVMAAPSQEEDELIENSPAQQAEQVPEDQAEADTDEAGQEPEVNEPEVSDEAEANPEPGPVQQEEEKPEPPAQQEQEPQQQEESAPPQPPVSASASPAAGPSSTPSNAPEPSKNQTTPSAGKSQGTYIASAESDKFHYPSCRAAKKITSENEIWFDTREAAINAGYVSCGICHP